MESAPEIFCTQDTKMTADRRNNKTLVDTITEYKTVPPDETVCNTFKTTSLILCNENTGQLYTLFYRL